MVLPSIESKTSSTHRVCGFLQIVFFHITSSKTLTHVHGLAHTYVISLRLCASIDPMQSYSMSVYTYIVINVYIYIFLPVYKYKFIYIYVCLYVHIHMYLCIHVYIYIYIYACILPCTLSPMLHHCTCISSNGHPPKPFLYLS